MEPYVEYQCANCGIKFSASYARFIQCCGHCGAPFVAYVEEKEEK